MSSAVQVRLETRSTGEQYVTEKQWQSATLKVCPWHPGGGCGFCQHGTYPRVRPHGTLIPRWYCPTERRTVSALPNFLASHRSGTLDECEAIVRTVENAVSREAACQVLRTDIELPGALRFVARVVRDVHQALLAIKGLMPTQFSCQPTMLEFSAQLGTSQVLFELRQMASDFMAQLPTPLGFNPLRNNANNTGRAFQHNVGRDPPVAFIDPIA